MTDPNSAMPWPPASQDSLLYDTIQVCFIFWSPFSCGWARVQQRPPWPPPVQLEKLLSMVFCCSERECKMMSFQCQLNKHCWTHCIELVGSALQSPYMITILLLSGAIREILMLSCTARPAQCIPGKLQSDDYKKSKHRAYALCIQWKIPWSPPIRIWSSDLHQFYNSLVSLHALEELLWNDVSCSHMKLMESFLIVQIAGWLSDNMATCLWRVGIYDYDWHLILCFRILCKSSTFQSVIVLIWHQRNESTSSLVNIQIMHFAILYAKLMKVCAVTSSALDAFEQALVAHWLWTNSKKLLLWSEAIACKVLKPLYAYLLAYISVNGMSSPIGISGALDVWGAHQLWRHLEDMLLWVGSQSCHDLQQLPELASTWISIHGMSDSRVEIFPQIDFCCVELHDSDQCHRQENTSDLQLSAIFACKPLIIFVAMNWQHDAYFINLIAMKQQYLIIFSSSVHRRWCHHSRREMWSLWSCQGSVQAAISVGAQAAWCELIAEQCHDRPTKGDTLLQISMGPWWLRLEGKPHFKRWGMSRTGPLRSGCQVGPGRGTAKDTKAEDHDGNGIEQQNEIFFLLKTALLLGCCS